MLEQVFTDPAAAQRHRAGLLGPHLDSFVEVLSNLGYSESTVRAKLWLLGDLARWLERRSLAASDLEEGVVARFFERRRRQGLVDVGERRTLAQFLEHLRQDGTIAAREPSAEESPLSSLQKRYEDYLRRERGLCAATITRYWPFLQRFILERFGDGPILLRDLTSDDISGFLLRHARSSSPGVAKLMVTALRSFFRFLFRSGEIKNDLAAAVATVPAWRLTAVPKYLEPEEIERLMDACDQSTPVGRRDRAVILLLARLGLRGGEVVGLELDDIDWRVGEVTVRGKGRSHDRLPLPHDVGEALASYLRQDRPNCSSRRLFVRRRAPHRGFGHASTVSTIVSRALKRAGLDPPVKGAHLLRHSLATGMLRRGASMTEIGEILRHRAPNTTEIYAKVDIKGLRSLAQPWPVMGGDR